jgi:hypothetical protein
LRRRHRLLLAAVTVVEKNSFPGPRLTRPLGLSFLAVATLLAASGP